MRASRHVSDSDTVRRQNRALVLAALRSDGPLARTQLAATTGLSHASITAITQDMLAQDVLVELSEERSDLKARGRPAVRVGFCRPMAYVTLIEVDVSRVRLSLVDYGATLVDRIEYPLTPGQFRSENPVAFLSAALLRLGERNKAQFTRLRRIAVSLQGILATDGRSLAWSPVPHLAGHDLVGGLNAISNAPVDLTKRGRLLAEGTRWLDPSLRDADVATVFIGSTVAMGLSSAARDPSQPDGGATEFGHMNHMPNGALCRCGMLGCIEAYAADYGILRTAYSVPERTAPAPAIPPAEYEQLIGRGFNGERSAVHAFNMAGRALGYGLNRLMAIHKPSHIVFVGPGARAFPLMRAEIDAALAASLPGKITGLPELRTLRDESEPIFQGLVMQTLVALDSEEIAAMPAARGLASG
jgi:predicted NBD/HSP70 family sugar kinase